MTPLGSLGSKTSTQTYINRFSFKKKGYTFRGRQLWQNCVRLLFEKRSTPKGSKFFSFLLDPLFKKDLLSVIWSCSTMYLPLFRQTDRPEQTEQSQIRCHRMQCLIRVHTVTNTAVSGQITRAQLFKTNDVVSLRFVKIYIEWYANILKFFAEKNVSNFCSAKATHIFSTKNIRILCIGSAKTVNEMTLNDVVKLTMLWTTGPR